MTEGERRRRRIRSARSETPRPVPGGGSPAADDPAEHVVTDGGSHTAVTSNLYDEAAAPIPDLVRAMGAVGMHDDRDERSLRGLIGGGASQVSVRAALRARDASRPTEDDIAAAEASLTIVHRGWTPRDT